MKKSKSVKIKIDISYLSQQNYFSLSLDLSLINLNFHKVVQNVFSLVNHKVSKNCIRKCLASNTQKIRLFGRLLPIAFVHTAKPFVCVRERETVL